MKSSTITSILYLVVLCQRTGNSVGPLAYAFVSPTTTTQIHKVGCPSRLNHPHRFHHHHHGVLRQSQVYARSPHSTTSSSDTTTDERSFSDLKVTSFSNSTTTTTTIQMPNENDPFSSFSSTTTASSSAAAAATAALSAPKDRLGLWKRRLITSEDPYSIHKISSILFTLSGSIILATAAIRFLQGPEIYADIPRELFLPTYIFTFSNIVMCVVSIRMSFLHRKYDLTARNAFLGTAASSLFSGFYYLWTNPLGPDILNNQIVTQACFAVLLILNVVLILDTCIRVSDVVEGRRDRKAERDNHHNHNVARWQQQQFWIDAMAYVFPVAWGLPFVVATGWVDAVLYNREWFFQQCAYVDQQIGTPGIQANLSYLQVLTSFGPAMGALFVTLRDKKLISKQQEVAGITIFSVPALVWTIWVTATFFSYMKWN